MLGFGRFFSRLGQLGVDDDSDNKNLLDDGAQKNVFFDNGWRNKNTNYLEPQMTFILIGKGLVLKGWPSKIKFIWALGSSHEQPGWSFP